MIKGVCKEIENIVNKDKINQVILDRKNVRENLLPNIGNVFDDKPDDREWFTFGGGCFDFHYTEFMNMIEGKGLDVEINYKFIDFSS